MKEKKTIQSIRKLLFAFMIILFLSGLTAIPINAELSFLLKIFSSPSELHSWLEKVLSAYKKVNNDTPFLLYGYDWLAFAHFILATLFIGPYRDPVLIFPLAFIAGPFRGIPIGWILIDCSFGLFGFLPLWICYSKTKELISKNYSIK